MICMKHFIKIFQKVQEIEPFSEFGPRQSIDQWWIAFDNPLSYILSISMYMQKFITTFLCVQEIGPFTFFFQNLELGKALTDDKYNFSVSWARTCQYQCVCKALSKYSKRFKSCGHFSRTVQEQTISQTVWWRTSLNLDLGTALTNNKCHLIIPWAINAHATFHYSIILGSRGMAIIHFFRIWSSAKPRSMINVILQSLGLDLVNINVYAKVYQNIPNIANCPGFHKLTTEGQGRL